ncbi:hypothetical protein NRB16_04155 [Pseudomonas sp. LJDD11]|uniref:hypothetical protein n=1 Tax=Pseudomonas sp. LJDD11 TaxID=2931984 RepID=UPI00211B78DC|nr:hypothetical protein [Pseudomonas sp. LJDD11]MCQ9422725.1 hypothetical protein [Pseudomonas sp. LJDD11]
MAITPIPLLPDAPSRSEGPAAFNAKSDPFIAALPPMVVNINVRLAAINEAVTTAEGYKNAAASSATAAANSAAAANTAKLAAQQAVSDASAAGAAQVNLAAQQVTLAKAQADLSKQHADSSQAYATAAQSAVGAPSLAGNAYKVLGVNGTATGVAWTWGLPNTALAARGQAVMWGNGQPVWGFPDRIGDVVMSANDPGSLYLPCDGTIRLKAPFPLLAAKLGSLGGKTGDFATQATSITTGSCIGIAVAPNPTPGGKPYILHAFANGALSISKDGGATWANVNLLLNEIGSLTALSLNFDLKNKKWIITLSGATGNAPSYYELGLEGYPGIIRAASGTVLGGAFSKIVCDKNGVWLALPTAVSRYVYRSTNSGNFNNGAWTQVDALQSALWADADTDDQGIWVLVGGSLSQVSRDSALTFKNVGPNASSGGSFTFVSTDKKGNWLVGGNAASGSFKRSSDNAINFYLSPSPVAVNAGFATSAYSDGFFFFATNTSIYSVPADPAILSVTGNGGNAYTIQPVTNIANMGRVAALDGWVFGAVTAVNNPIVVKSVPSYAYDTASQFALPYIPAPVGLNCYIRALEA